MFNQGRLDAIRARFENVFLTDTVMIEKATEARSDSGDIITTWISVGTYPAIVEPLTSREMSSMGYDLDTTAYSVSTPHDAPVKMGDRFDWHGKKLVVTQCLNDDTNMVLLESVAVERNV